jgi:hypothetical protein
MKDCANISHLTFGDIDDSQDDCLAECLAVGLLLNPSIQNLSMHGCWINNNNNNNNDTAAAVPLSSSSSSMSTYSIGALVNE